MRATTSYFHYSAIVLSLFGCTNIAKGGQAVAQESKVIERLAATTSLKTNPAPIEQFVDYLKDFSAIPIMLDWPGFKAAGISPKIMVSGSFKELPLFLGLARILKEHGLCLTLRHGVVIITTPKRNSRLVWVYTPANGQNADELVDLIRRTVLPKSWKRKPGVVLHTSTGKIVIAHSLEAQLYVKLRFGQRLNRGTIAPLDCYPPGVQAPTEALETRTTLDFFKTPFSQVSATISQKYNLRITYELATDPEINFGLRKTELGQALSILLQQVQLEWLPSSSNAIRIVPAGDARKNGPEIAYRTKAGVASDELQQFIQLVFYDEPWNQPASHSTIRLTNEAIVIKNGFNQHMVITTVLRQAGMIK